MAHCLEALVQTGRPPVLLMSAAEWTGYAAITVGIGVAVFSPFVLGRRGTWRFLALGVTLAAFAMYANYELRPRLHATAPGIWMRTVMDVVWSILLLLGVLVVFRKRRGSIFVSYRDADSGTITGWMVEGLKKQFGPRAVVIDWEADLDGPFRARLEELIREARVVLAVIGNAWHGAQSDGTRRIDGADDVLRQELETALENRVPLIPVLTDGLNRLPADLPPSLSPLAQLHAAPLENGRRFGNDLTDLVGQVGKHVP